MAAEARLWRASRWWFIVMIAAGAGCEGARQNPGDRPRAAPSFTDVTEQVGLGEFRHVTGAVGNFWMPETMGGGGGFMDYNSDGHLDILLVRGGTWSNDVPALALYANQGDGRFAEQTAEAGLAGVRAYAFGPTVADIDNDGDEDFYLTTLRENMLFRNDSGVFSEVAAEAGVAGPPEWSSTAVFFDADLDGWLDLFVGNYIEWAPEVDRACSLADGIRSYCTPHIYDGLPGRFYRNRGDGTFEEVTEHSGLGSPAPGKTLAATMLDYNRDRYPDIVVVNDTERDLLYTNNRDGTFDEIGTVSGIAFDRYGTARAGMGVDVGVMDSTGHPTVFVANFSREMIGAYRLTEQGRFVDRAAQARIGQASMNALSFGLFVFDADLDGHLDLFVANGHISPDVHLIDDGVSYRQPAQLYRNDGNGSFELVKASGENDVWNTEMVARGASYGDYDSDGDPDVLVIENGGPAHLWRNDVRERGYLRVQLEGKGSNRSAIGARVDVHDGEHRMTQQVRSGGSYLSSSEKVLSFGLGAAAEVDSVVVTWPSGRIDLLEGVSGNQQVRIIEGSTTGGASAGLAKGR